MSKILFSQVFQTIQQSNVAGKSLGRVFYGAVPPKYVGFLYMLGSSDNPNVTWFWYIDGEKVEESQRSLGNMNQPTVFNPPFVIKKSVEIKVFNNNDETVLFEVFCGGDCYPLPDPIALQPLLHDESNALLKDIKTELQSTKPKGEVTDELVDVTSAVYDLYIEGPDGLAWTTCSIVNQGPNDVYVAVNVWKQPDAPLPTGESMNIDLGVRGAIKRIYMVCNAGETATVRLHAIK